ncbi:sensor protein PhoQ [mine drainage metagenome]|uniref:histidine kinase n=1 Tax=mine drainage metagenome TaxID=410659 RepID=A0A1J5Q2X9_9ZZZZ
MKTPWSIRSRLVWAAAIVLLAFLAGAGWTVQKAYADSVRTQRLARLQATVYLLMAATELDSSGTLLMPPTLAEPRLSLPASGLYASIVNLDTGKTWQSASTLGRKLPFQRHTVVGQWQLGTLSGPQSQSDSQRTIAYLGASYAVKWSANDKTTPLVFSVLEDRLGFERELLAFERTLWSWLGGTGLLLLLTQTWLLRWGLAPLEHMSQEIERIEQGRQARVERVYPKELTRLTNSLNALIEQERARQVRYKEAVDDLAHSLKTPLAVLRTCLDEPAGLASMVAQQVARMDAIVVHQLARAGASGAARFAPFLQLAPVLQRIRDTLGKIYHDKNLAFTLECANDLSWRIDQGDAFEMLGNVLDNAAKWARQKVSVRLWQDRQGLCIRVSDDGPGFADSAAQLQRRVRLDEQVPGHGIGLSVVKDLVASHLGQLQIARSDWGGAEVSITLPWPHNVAAKH